jgi:Xaa-Pro aminopeptidase
MLHTGSGANGAIVHYRAEEGTCGQVDNQKLFLLDSGAQYVDGTTDITRTVHFGTPSPRQKECFTRVLQVLHILYCFNLISHSSFIIVII